MHTKKTYPNYPNYLERQQLYILNFIANKFRHYKISIVIKLLTEFNINYRLTYHEFYNSYTEFPVVLLAERYTSHQHKVIFYIKKSTFLQLLVLWKFNILIEKSLQVNPRTKQPYKYKLYVRNLKAEKLKIFKKDFNTQ